MEKQKKINKIRILLYIIFIFIIIIDQVSKILIAQKSIILIPDFFSLIYTQDTGVVFGLLPNNLIIIIPANIVVLGLIIKFIKENKNTMNYPVTISLMLILAGGVSNFIDRIFRGYIVDFININLFTIPTFNIADISITIGIIILLISIIKQLFFNKKE